jgi:purine-cytosine permease-like protein
MALSVGVFGWLAILYGLSWWATVSAIVVGTAAGALVVTPLALLGFRAATNNSVASGAYFGVRGRLVAIVAIYGFRWLLRVNTAIVVVVGIAMLLTVIGLAGRFDATYPGAPDAYALGSFWPTWLLAALTAGIAGPLSYVTQIGDWTRYISPRRHRPAALLLGTFTGLLAGLLIPTLWGAYVSSILFDENSFPVGLVAGVPSWLLVPVVLAALVGSIGQGAMNLYSMGLDLDAILPRLSRMQSTLVVTVLATVLVFLGKFVWDAEVAVTAFVVFLTSLATPWAAVTLIGLWRTGGHFDQPDLQVFNERGTGGRYWYHGGWNPAAVLAWLVGSTVGVLSNATSSFTGPIAAALGGVDASFVTSGLAAAAVYLILVALRPRWLARSSSAATEPAAAG